jgi:hypothetical protein
MLMVIEDPAHVDDSAMPVAWWRDSLSEASSIPVVHLNRRQLARALPDLDFTQLAEGIDLTLQPQSRRLQGITVAYIDHRAQFTAPLRNVVGLLPGSDPALADEAVVVGAHYDTSAPVESYQTYPSPLVRFTTAPTTTPPALPRCSRWHEAQADRGRGLAGP